MKKVHWVFAKKWFKNSCRAFLLKMYLSLRSATFDIDDDFRKEKFYLFCQSWGTWCFNCFSVKVSV